MKKIILLAVFCVSFLIMTQSALAQQNGVGVGAVINGPTGLSYKAWIADDVAVAGALTFTVGEGFDQLYTHADVIVHSRNMLSGENAEEAFLKPYFGGGVSFNFFNNPDLEQVSLRVPFGITYGLQDMPVDAFFEIVPTIQFIDIGRFGFDGALGFRYYLN